MKKILKIVGYFLLGLLLLVIGIPVFFNSKYNSAHKELTGIQANLADKGVSFYRFELRNDSVSELSLLPLPKRFTWEKGQLVSGLSTL